MLTSSKPPRFSARLLAPALLCALAVLAACTLSGCDQHTSKPKRASMVKLLPDTPPPPPPKQEEKKPEPIKEDKPQQQINQPKPAEAPPQPQALKTDEAPGEGQGNGMQSGAVTQDYAGGQIGSGAGGNTGTQSNRAQYQFYFNTARQQLKDQLDRNLHSDEREVVVNLTLWFANSGEISRYEFAPTGNAVTDGRLKAAMAETSAQLRLPPPATLPMPIRLRITVHPT